MSGQLYTRARNLALSAGFAAEALVPIPATAEQVYGKVFLDDRAEAGCVLGVIYSDDLPSEATFSVNLKTDDGALIYMFLRDAETKRYRVWVDLVTDAGCPRARVVTATMYEKP